MKKNYGVTIVWLDGGRVEYDAYTRPSCNGIVVSFTTTGARVVLLPFKNIKYMYIKEVEDETP